MNIDIKKNWYRIKDHFRESIKAGMHVSIASVDADNKPTVTPIGSLFLNADQTGFYFEKFATKLNKNSVGNKHVCLLAVNSSKWFWLVSLFKGKFSNYPAVKLYGELGNKRKATPKEFRAFQKRVKSTKMLRGHKYLWEEMSMVREIKFTKAEKINLGKMTKYL